MSNIIFEKEENKQKTKSFLDISTMIINGVSTCVIIFAA